MSRVAKKTTREEIEVKAEVNNVNNLNKRRRKSK